MLNEWQVLKWKREVKAKFTIKSTEKRALVTDIQKI